MSSGRLLAGFLGLAGCLGGGIDLDRWFDTPAPKRPRPAGADERDMLAAEAKRARRAERNARVARKAAG